MKRIQIQTPQGERHIGPGQPVFIVAELSGNHHHSYDEAVRLIDAAADADVDAVKLQTYTPDTITINSDKEYFQVRVNDAWVGQTLYQLYQKAFTPWEWQPKLKRYAEDKGLVLFSTPFDVTAVDFLEDMDVSLYKVASFEIVDIPLLEKIGQTKKPVIMSRGMASVQDIELAVQTLRANGTPVLAILHCVSAYPAAAADMHLKTIPDIQQKFKVVSGLSDHTLGTTVAVAAVALGASVIEKHITLKRADGGPDAAFSMEPAELKQMVEAVRETEAALGHPCYTPITGEQENLIFRKSLFVVQNMEKGDSFTASNVRSIRPGHGLLPRYLNDVIGKKAAQSIERGTPVTWDLIKK